MTRRYRFVPAMGLFLLLFLLPANAFAARYGVMGSSHNTTGQATWGYGCLTRNYVQVNPTVVYPDGKHVNSIYVHYDNYNRVEVGWYKAYGSTNSQTFSAVRINGQFTENYHGAIAQGSYADFKIESTPGTSSWKCYINGWNARTWTMISDFKSGIPLLGSERVNLGDNNSGDFQNLQFREGNVTWKYWPQIWDVVPEKPDPGYVLVPYDSLHKALVAAVA